MKNKQKEWHRATKPFDLSQTFYSHIYPQNVQFLLYANSNGFQKKYFNCLLLLRF